MEESQKKGGLSGYVGSRFFLRIALRLAVLFLALAVCLLVLFNHFWRSFIQENVQVANWELAGHIARDAQPFVGDTVDYPELLHLFYRYYRLFYGADFYLVDGGGNIVTYFTNGHPLESNKISLTPVRRFIEPDSGATPPLSGDDPVVAGGSSVFSAARIPTTDEKDWFIYVVLRNWKSSAQEDIATKGFVLRSGILGFAAVFIATFALGSMMLFLLTKRIRALNRSLNAFRAGDFDARIADHSPDEIGQMAETFNSMAESVQRLIAELAESDRRRRELVANISHDLRTPLTAAIGNIEIIGASAHKKEDTALAEHSERALRTLDYLSRLVSELFELAKLEAKERQPEFRTVAVDSLLELLSMKFEPLAEEKRLTLAISVDNPPLFCKADPEMLERVLSNLVENAIRYNRPGGAVTVRATRRDGSIAFSVQDNGIGIAQEDLPQIFDRLYRGRDGRARKIEGSGLGLAIVKRLLETHGSAITAESVVDEGTTFSFSLESVAGPAAIDPSSH